MSLRESAGVALSNFLTGMPGKYASIDDPSLHGRYIGISPIAAGNGVPYNQCLLSFSLDQGGITMHSRIESDGTEYEFRVHYSPEWIFRLRNWGVDNCISLRQHRNSKLACCILMFAPRTSLASHDVIMMLGEGMPAVLGAFVRAERGEKVLQATYQKIRKLVEADKEEVQQGERKERSWLMELPGDPEQILSTGSTTERVQLMNACEHNLWTATTDEVERRLSIVEHGLKDSSPSVRAQALSVFVLGGRVTGGVPLVCDFLRDRFTELPLTVLKEAVQAGQCLMYEVHRYREPFKNLADRFGTHEVSAIHAASNGLITPEQEKLLEEVARSRPAHRIWTPEHLTQLRAALEPVAAAKLLPEFEQGELERALKDYRL